MSDYHESLMMRYLDSALSPEETGELSDHLRKNPASRDKLREIAEQAQMMADVARERSSLRPSRGVAWMNDPRVRRWRGLALSLSVSLLLLVGAMTAWCVVSRPQAVLQLTGNSGEVVWTAENDWNGSNVRVGEWLRPGSILVPGETTSAEFRFTDGTTITLLGNSELVVAGNHQKKLILRSGSLTAQVTPQPDGRPMLVRTPTAELEVLGTIFTLAANETKTALVVDRGQVRLRRLSDREEIEVNAGHSAEATLDVETDLQTQPKQIPPNRWAQTFERSPQMPWSAIWKPPSNNAPGRLAAVPLLAGKRDGERYIEYGANLRIPGNSLASVDANSVLHLRWRTDRPVWLHIMLGLGDSKGRFVNNFHLGIRPDRGDVDNNGWRTIYIPLSDFNAGDAGCRALPRDGRLNHVFITSERSKAGLEIAEVGVEQVASASDP